MRKGILDKSYIDLLPSPLAARVLTLAEETALNGVHTTADELVHCIEAVFGLVGRVWVAEYLAVGAMDPHANALLYEVLVPVSRDPLMGVWLQIGRTLRAVFVKNGIEPVARGLLDLTFGEPGDLDHPVARLCSYRNSFAHGSFHAVVEDIVTHRELLEDLLVTLPFLTEQPVLVDDGTTVVALRGIPSEVASRPPVLLTLNHPTLVGDDGRTVDLWPLAIGRNESGAAALCWTSLARNKRGDAVSPRAIANHERFAIWAERYQRELEGDVEAAATCLDAAPLASEGPRAELGAAIERVARTGRCLVLVTSPPGAPRTALLAHAARTVPSLRWRVTPNALMGSGHLLVKAIARHAEQRLGLARQTIATKDAAAWRQTLKDVAARCEAASLRLSIVIEDLHLGDIRARPGEPSVLEVWRQLATGPWTAVGGAMRAWSTKPLAWDARVELGWEAGVEQSEVKRFLALRATSQLHKRVLAALLRFERGSDLFSVCDALESSVSNMVVFEPAVERALWDLAPVLAMARVTRIDGDKTEEVRVFSPISKQVLEAVMAEAQGT